MSQKSLTGKKGIIYDGEKGALIEGDAVTPLADNSWFIINSDLFHSLDSPPQKDIGRKGGV